MGAVEVVAFLRANTSQFTAEMGKARSEMAKLEHEGSGNMEKVSAVGKMALLGMAGAAVGAGAMAVDMGMKFQSSMTSLVTGAGESESNIKTVSNGILNMAGQVGISSKDLAAGMYMIESAGYHGSAGLSVLRAAAEGAKVGNADLATVADAVTSSLNAYGLKGKDATGVTNELVATVAAGKMHMQDLAGALAAVVPTAAAAHIQLSDVGAAVATMTAQGTSAQQATQDLAFGIRALQNPSQVQIAQMEQMGLNSTDLATNLGKRGLASTYELLAKTVTTQMGPSGLVLLNSMKQSESAAKDAKIMFDQLPTSLQSVAAEFQKGDITQKQWKATIKSLPVDQRQLATEFAATVNASRGFNDQLKSGGPAAETFNAAMSKLTGGATGLSVALQLTGSHQQAFIANTVSIYNAGTKTNGAVEGMAQVHKTLQFQMDSAKATAGALATRLGLVLIPTVQKVMSVVMGVVTWFEKHKVVAEALAVAVGTVLTAAIAAYIAKITLAAVENVVQFAKMTVSVVTWIAANLAGLVQLGVAWTVYTVRWLAENVAAFATFVAEHAAMAAAFVVQNLLMIASATAAFIAENAATLGIVAGIALLVAGIIYLATHWSQVWTDIKTWVAEGADWVRKHFYIIMAIPFVGWIIELAANWRMVWDMIKATIALAWSIIQPIFNFIKTLGIDVISTAINDLKTVWNTAWSLISGAISGYWAIFGPIFGFIKTLGIDVIQTAVSTLQTVWNGAWSAISGAVSTAWSAMQPVIATITGAVGDAQKAWDWLFGGGGQPAHNNVVGSGGATINPPHKASGGSVTGLTPYLVGEQGPELFTPAASGSITPNNALGGGGSNQPINVTLQIDGQTLAQVLLTNQLRMKRTGGYGTLGLA